MKSKYRIEEDKGQDSIYSWNLYNDGEFINNYIDKEDAERVKEKLEELDRLKESSPESTLLKCLENFIKII